MADCGSDAVVNVSDVREFYKNFMKEYNKSK